MEDNGDVHGGKRKYKENPLTAKAETGSLKIKIMRKGEGLQNGGLLVPGLNRPLEGFAFAGMPRSPVNAAPPPQQLPSPPKPRANRKHVPIFYQRPNAFDISATSSTDESIVPTASVTSDYDASVNASSTASTSSAAGRFARMDIVPGLPGSLSDPMPMSNPLFTRGMSENSGSLTDLLRTVMPSAPHSMATGSFDFTSSSSAMSAADHMSASPSSLMNPAAALRQLASSSAAYASQSREPTLLPSMQMNMQLLQQEAQQHRMAQQSRYQNDYHTNQSQQQQQQDQQSHDHDHHTQQQQDPPNYRFDAMSALQNAVKIAVATTSPTTRPSLGRWLSSSSSNNDDSDLGPPPSILPSLSAQNSLLGDLGPPPSATPALSAQISLLADLGPPPSGPPGLSVQHSLMGGELGPPPSAPPGLSIQHSLMGGGIEAPPAIPTINTVNFNWNRYHQANGRARSGSIPSVITEDGPPEKSSATATTTAATPTNGHGAVDTRKETT